MNLLCFAHRAEAEAFFIEFNLKALTEINSLYECKEKDFYLLITGEGTYSSMVATTSALNLTSNINKVFNFGVSGAACTSFKKNDIFTIRTCYLAEGDSLSLQFKSFPLIAVKGLIEKDLISCSIRVKNSLQRKKLFPFGDLIDREAWGIAYASKYKNIPFSAVKIVSDTDRDLNFCQTTKNQSYNYSHKLLEVYKKNILLESELSSDEKTQSIIQIFEHPSFYFTTSQKRKVIKIANETKLSLDTLLVIAEKIVIEENKKNNSKKFLNTLVSYVSPELFEYARRAKQILAPINQKGITSSHDPSFETDSLEVKASLKSKEDLETFKAALRNFNYENWQNFTNGRF